MFSVYTWDTPNGKKPVLFLEEVEAEYALHMVDIGAGAQKDDAFLRVNPNGKIPALVVGEGDEGFRVFESGAMLLTLAEHFGKLLPPDPAGRAECLGWVFWQVGGLGPMLGQWHHFLHYDEKEPHALTRFHDEVIRLFQVLDDRLGEAAFLAGDAYSIADIMSWAWAKGGLKFLDEADGVEAPDFKNVHRWVNAIAARPATVRALDKLANAAKAARA